jgi:exonuclease SbcC
VIPERLKLQAFGPYAGALDLDFDALLSQGLFLVHGPTGAGKTSILDAICYALFGEASSPDRAVRQLRSDYARPDTPTEVVLDFRLGAERYRIVRRPEQPRLKKRGGGVTTERPTAKLFSRTGIGPQDPGKSGRAIAVHTRKVDAAIERLLGFSAAQFRQVVLLPQGRFRELLTAGSKERERILEALFDTARYRAVEEALKDAAREARERVRELRAQREAALRQAGVTDPHALEAAAELLAESKARLQKERNALETRAKAANQALEQGRRAAERYRDLDEVARELGALAREAPRIERTRAELEDARRALPFEALASEANRLSAELSEAEARAASATRVLKQARSAAIKAEQTERARSVAARLRKIDEFERLGEAITAAAKRRVGAQAQRADALAEVESAEAALEQASQALKEQQIQALARDLPPDTPCPVCGSHTHPGIDPHSPAGGTQDAAGPSGGLAAAHRQVKVLRQALIRSERELVQTEAEHASAKERQRLVQASWLADDPEEAARLQAEGVGARTEALKRDLGRARQLGGRPDGPRARTREQTEAAHREAARHAAAAQASLEAAQAELVRAQRRLKESARRSAVALEAAGFQHPAALEAARRSEAAVALLTAKVRRHEEAFSLARARRAQAQERTRDLTRPNLAALDRTGKDLAEQVLLKVRQEARVEEQQRSLAQATESLKATTADLATAEVRQARLSRLAAVAGGRNGAGITFQRYVLASLLDRVLVVASQRLASMTRGRYRLERRDQDRADLRAAGGLRRSPGHPVRRRGLWQPRPGGAGSRPLGPPRTRAPRSPRRRDLTRRRARTPNPNPPRGHGLPHRLQSGCTNREKSDREQSIETSVRSLLFHFAPRSLP